MMGAHPYDNTQGLNETRHLVTITKPFFIGVFQVTQKQWNLVMGTWPSFFNNPQYRDSRPVASVSYYLDIRGSDIWPDSNTVDRDSFLGRLRKRTNLTFDLPTEAQWEYACRAGTDTAFNIGGALAAQGPWDPGMDRVGRYRANGGDRDLQNCDTSGGTNKVGSYIPNNWGLYDMHGNVWEWCLDWYCDDLGNGNETDPRGPETGQYRVLRGGSYSVYAEDCRSSTRKPTNMTSGGHGIRLAAVFGGLPIPIYSDSTSVSIPYPPIPVSSSESLSSSTSESLSSSTSEPSSDPPIPPWSDPDVPSSEPSTPIPPWSDPDVPSSDPPIPPWSDPDVPSSDPPIPPWSDPDVPSSKPSTPVPPWSDPDVPSSDPYVPSEPGYQQPSNPYYDSSDMSQPYDY